MINTPKILDTVRNREGAASFGFATGWTLKRRLFGYMFLLVCLLGLTAVLLALLIFANTISSDIEQERNKIGILQSLGVSNKQLIRRQLYIGLAVSGFAVLIANILLWSGIALYALLSDAVLGNLLWGYPWWLHFIACIVLAAIITMLYILPMKNIQKYLPIENIKTRK